MLNCGFDGGGCNSIAEEAKCTFDPCAINCNHTQACRQYGLYCGNADSCHIECTASQACANSTMNATFSKLLDIVCNNQDSGAGGCCSAHVLCPTGIGSVCHIYCNDSNECNSVTVNAIGTEMFNCAGDGCDDIVLIIANLSSVPSIIPSTVPTKTPIIDPTGIPSTTSAYNPSSISTATPTDNPTTEQTIVAPSNNALISFISSPTNQICLYYIL